MVNSYEKEVRNGVRLFIDADNGHCHRKRFHVHVSVKGITVGYFDKNKNFTQEGVTEGFFRDLVPDLSIIDEAKEKLEDTFEEAREVYAFRDGLGALN